MVGALEALGVEVEADWGAGRARVRGCDGQFPVDGAELFLGNAGTAMRFGTNSVQCHQQWLLVRHLMHLQNMVAQHAAAKLADTCV